MNRLNLNHSAVPHDPSHVAHRKKSSRCLFHRGAFSLGPLPNLAFKTKSKPASNKLVTQKHTWSRLGKRDDWRRTSSGTAKDKRNRLGSSNPESWYGGILKYPVSVSSLQIPIFGSAPTGRFVCPPFLAVVLRPLTHWVSCQWQA